MKITDVITNVRALQPSAFENEAFVRWLSEFDNKIYRDIMVGHEGAPEAAPDEYDVETDMDTELLVPFPDDGDLYTMFLCAKIDWHNKEYDRYNNGMIAVNNAISEYSAAYNREHAPLQSVTLTGM